MQAAPIGFVLGLVLALGVGPGGARADRPFESSRLAAQSPGIVAATHGKPPSSGPPSSLQCKPPDRPRQVWDCGPAPCTAHLVWRCELWCKPGHYPTLGEVRANGGKAKCVKHAI